MKPVSESIESEAWVDPLATFVPSTDEPDVEVEETTEPDDEPDSEHWLWKREVRPDVGALVQPDKSREFDIEEVTYFFEKLAEDYGPMEIGLSRGWSPAMVKRFVTDPDRAALIEMFEEAQHESVERGILSAARTGNATAMKIYAYNKMQHRGWSDRSKLEVTGRSQTEIVLSVREALETHMAGAVGQGGQTAIAELQEAFLTPDIPVHDVDDQIVEAEVVEDVHG